MGAAERPAPPRLFFFFPGPGRIPQVVPRRASGSSSLRVPLCLICPPTLAVCELPLAALPCPVADWPTQGLRQNALLAFGVCHSTLPLSALPVTGAGDAVPPALVCWFSLCLCEGKTHQTISGKEETHNGKLNL